METIALFDGEYAFLSNFYSSPITISGINFPTVEHAFQALKTIDAEERKKIAVAATPGQAKRLGRKVQLRQDWEEVKENVMYICLKAKFDIPELREKLLATGESELIEGNWWGDTYWGVCNGIGQNRLGQLLMRLRTELK